MSQNNLMLTGEDKSIKDLMRDIFLGEKRREFYWDTLTDEVLARMWHGEWPKGVKASMQKTIQQLFPEVRRDIEEAKEGVFCPTFKDHLKGKTWKIVAQTLKDLEEDSQDVVNELLRRARREAAYHEALIRGKDAAIEQKILDTVTIEKELEAPSEK